MHRNLFLKPCNKKQLVYNKDALHQSACECHLLLLSQFYCAVLFTLKKEAIISGLSHLITGRRWLRISCLLKPLQLIILYSNSALKGSRCLWALWLTMKMPLIRFWNHNHPSGVTVRFLKVLFLWILSADSWRVIMMISDVAVEGFRCDCVCREALARIPCKWEPQDLFSSSGQSKLIRSRSLMLCHALASSGKFRDFLLECSVLIVPRDTNTSLNPTPVPWA